MFRRLWRDEDGQILIMFTVMLPVLLGFVGLALEANRFMMSHSELQNLADAAALAGANQLDGTANSIANARQAALDFSNNNRVSWADELASGTYRIDAPKVYDNINDTVESTTPAKARYVKVTTKSASIFPMFLVAAKAISPLAVTATAMAESTFVACNVQPLMLCNPNGAGDFTPSGGDIYGFTQQGSTGGMSPGVFSLLDPPTQTNSSAPDIKNNLAATNPPFCYLNNMSPRTGDPASAIAQGINVRFDMQPNGGLKGLDGTPDKIVIKGAAPNQCLSQIGNGANAVTVADEMPINTGTTQQGSTRTGGTFDIASANQYWKDHHGTNNNLWPTDATGKPLSRYQVYQSELTNSGIYTFIPGTEPSGPHCVNSATWPAKNDRRIISVAVVDCGSPQVHGNSVDLLTSTSYFDFFIIRPVDQSGIIWTELVRKMTLQSDGSKLHHIVQLVRDF
jgi:Flp pilus assembly protein TadG